MGFTTVQQYCVACDKATVGAMAMLS